MHRLALIAGLAASAAGLVLASGAGADSTGPTAQVTIPRGQPVEITLANDLTGVTSAFGPSIANAVQMAAEAHPTVRGFPIQVNIVDSPCGNPAADVATAMTVVANAHNVGVLGQLCSFGFDQALPVYEAGGVVTISGSASSDALPAFAPNVFDRTVVDDGDGVEAWYSTVSGLPGDLAWQQAYQARFDSKPMPLADLYYDAAGLLIKSLQKVSSVDDGSLVVDRAALAAAVRSTTRYQGVTCTVTLDPATGNRVNDPDALARCGA